MPIWAWIYIGIVLVCGYFGYKMNRNQGAYYLPGEILSVLSITLLFCIAYGVITFQYELAASIVITLYVVYWEGWENRHNYNFSSISEEVSDAFLEESDPEEKLDEETAEAIGKMFAIVAYIFVVVFLLPVFYVFIKIVLKN
jgi:small-conductance mechanosensitive channel